MQLGTIHTFCAEYTQARAHQTQVLTLYTTAEHESLSLLFRLGPSHSSCTRSPTWVSGCLDGRTRAGSNTTISLARARAASGHTSSSVNAASTAAIVALLRGDLDEARQLVDQSIPLAALESWFFDVQRDGNGCARLYRRCEAETSKQASIP